jgi:hypothetical protein
MRLHPSFHAFRRWPVWPFGCQQTQRIPSAKSGDIHRPTPKDTRPRVLPVPAPS